MVQLFCLIPPPNYWLRSQQNLAPQKPASISRSPRQPSASAGDDLNPNLGFNFYFFQTGKLALLAIMVSGGIVLQVLACALYNNWWPMLTVIMYVFLPMPLMFFMGSDSSLMSSSTNGWVNFTKFLTGASIVGSIAIPCILKHANVIGWGALTMELSSFLVFVISILCFVQTGNEDDYNMF